MVRRVESIIILTAALLPMPIVIADWFVVWFSWDIMSGQGAG